MILFPAIDLKDGACVRLHQGDMNTATEFNADPADQARQFCAGGAEYLHLVDLNGAFAGHAVNQQAVSAILTAIDIPVQLGGGIRSHADIARWLEAGIRRVILGTVAARDPALVREAASRWPGQIVVGIDAWNGRVAVNGWAEHTEILARELAAQYEDAGVAAIIYTDIERDGAMAGPNIAATAALARSVQIPVIASGGVSSLEDLRALRDCGVPLEGVISGRAIYDGRIALEAGIALLRERLARC